MRLINVSTGELREFSDANLPKYAILSHRWGPDEITYDEYRAGQKRESRGYSKVVELCRFVQEATVDLPSVIAQRFRQPLSLGLVWLWNLSGVEWVWVDTCCIDQRSSAELSETVNSMFGYYERFSICIAYLADVGPTTCNFLTGQETIPCDSRCHECTRVIGQLESSEWFKRGWTLQELVEPHHVLFLSSDWTVIGWKAYLAERIANITHIPSKALTDGTELRSYSIAQRISWASGRRTTRIEDEAYSLLGLLDINMPLIYGEGPQAWARLQQEIINTSSDETISAWQSEYRKQERRPVFSKLRQRFRTSHLKDRRIYHPGHDTLYIKPTFSVKTPLLSALPRDFVNSTSAVPCTTYTRQPYSLTNQGLQLRLEADQAFRTATTISASEYLVVPLNCFLTSDGTKQPLMLMLRPFISRCGHWDRVSLTSLARLKQTILADMELRPCKWRACEAQNIVVHTNSLGCRSTLWDGNLAPIDTHRIASLLNSDTLDDPNPSLSQVGTTSSTARYTSSAETADRTTTNASAEPASEMTVEQTVSPSRHRGHIQTAQQRFISRKLRARAEKASRRYPGPKSATCRNRWQIQSSLCTPRYMLNRVLQRKSNRKADTH